MLRVVPLSATRAPLVCALLVLVAWLARAGDARAQDPPPKDGPPPEEPPPPSGARFEIAARGGYTTTPIAGAVSPFGFGAGARIGLVLSNVYIGAGAIDYLGGSDGSATEHAVLYGVEVGYGFHLGDAVLLRPTIGGGGAALLYTEPPTTSPGQRADVVTSASGRGSGGRSSTTTVNGAYVEPGVTLLYSFGDAFVGAEGSVVFLPSVTYADGSIATYASLSLRAQMGYRF